MAFTTNFSGDYEDVLQRFSTTALQQAEDVANLPFTQYGGERVAGFSPTELAGRERAAELAQMGLGMPQAQQAADVASQVAGFSYTDPAAVGARMNPFVQQALDPALRQLQEQQQMALQNVGANAAQSGAFGGSRQGVLEAEALKGFGQQASDLLARGYASAFDRATDLMGQEARQQLAGASALSGAANQLRQLGFADADVLRTLGAEERGLQQAQMESDFAEFLRSQAFPAQQLTARLSPLGFGSQVATAAPTIQQPSQFQSLLGNLGAIGSVAGMVGGGYEALTGNPLSSIF